VQQWWCVTTAGSIQIVWQDSKYCTSFSVSDMWQSVFRLY